MSKRDISKTKSNHIKILNGDVTVGKYFCIVILVHIIGKY